MKRYINLNTHSQYTKGETVIEPKEIIKFAVRDGAKAIALTDLDSVGGFMEFSRAAKNQGIKPIYGVQIFGLETGSTKPPRKFTLLAKNRTGLKNIYKIISFGFKKALSENIWPCVSYEDIQNNRDGILVGMECTKSDMYQVWTDDEQDHEGEKTYELIDEEYAIADYVEIKPWTYYRGMMSELADVIYPEEVNIKWLMYEIVRGLKDVQKFAVADDGAKRFLTTEELLDEYSLPEDYSYFNDLEMAKISKILVLDDPNAIADLIETFYIDENVKCPFEIENAETILKESSKKALREKYGENVPSFILERYQSELNIIFSNEYASYFVLGSKLIQKSKELGYLYNLRGSGGDSFIEYLLGMTEINPLAPHYYCTKCKHVEVVDADEYPSGFDLNCFGKENKRCPHCGNILIGDGHNISAGILSEYNVDRGPDFVFDFASNICNDIMNYLDEIFGEDKVYCDVLGDSIEVAIVPKEKDIYDFTPVGYDNIKQRDNNIRPSTLINSIELPFKSIAIIPTDMFYRLKQLEERTGVKANSIDFSEIDILSFFQEGDFSGLPFDLDYERHIYNEILPARFSDLVRMLGIELSIGTWENNGEILVAEHPIEELIAYRDDVTHTLIKYGIDGKQAFDITERTRKGMAKSIGLKKDMETELIKHNIPEWYIESMKKIEYLWQKAHGVGEVMNYLRLIWYKINYPEEFDAVMGTGDTV